MNFKHLFWLSLALIFTSCASHDRINRQYSKRISPENLQKDVRFVHRNLERLHPELYWYIPKDSLDHQFENLSQGLDRPLTGNEFYLKIAPVVASVRQAHMFMGLLPRAVPDSLRKKYKGSTGPLSHFRYEFDGSHLLLDRVINLKDPDIRIGAEVLEVNGLRPEELFKKYEPTYTSDGYNQTGIPKLFARRFNYYLSEELGLIDTLQLKFKCGDQIYTKKVLRKFKSDKTKTAPASPSAPTVQKKPVVKPTSKKELTKAEKKEKKKREKALAEKRQLYGYDKNLMSYTKDLSFPLPTDSTVAVLKIRSFSSGKLKAYDSIFTRIKKHEVQNLILDLRGNGGGRLNDVYELTKYFHSEPYRFLEPALATNRFPYMHSLRGKFTLGTVFTAPFLGIYSLVRAPGIKKVGPKAYSLSLKASRLGNPESLHYDGKLYVLIDGMSFSASSLLAAHLKGRPRTLIVGQETGGAHTGTVAGQMPTLILPHSKLPLTVGLLAIRPVAIPEKEGSGVRPDVEIRPTAEQIVNKIDPEMTWVLQDIKNRKISSPLK